MQTLFIPFSKVDSDERIVEGYASTPTLDLQGEKVSLDAIKRALPDFQQWNNLRYMHQPHVIGTAEDTRVDEKGLFLRGKIGDDEAWKAVKDGRLKGFSIGGERINKSGDTITDLRLLEISLVDRPANPDCRIDLFRAAGLPSGDKGIQPSTPASDLPGAAAKGAQGADSTFTREEVGFLGRIIGKLGFGKAGPAAAHDGFSLPANQIFQPDPLADERLANMRPLGTEGGTGGDVTLQPPGRGDAGGPGLVESDDAEYFIPEYHDAKTAAAGGKNEIPEKVRTRLAAAGKALPDGSYPIRNKKDLEDAVSAFGRAKNKAKVRAWIISRAKELKATDMLPEDWPGSTKNEEQKTSLASTVAKGGIDIWVASSNSSRLADVYDRLISLAQSLRWEADQELGDKKDYTQSKKVSRLAQAVGTLLAEHAAEEVQEEKQREAARKALTTAGITSESINMSKTIFDVPGAAGAGGNGAGDAAEIAKRIGERHRKVHAHLKEARKHDLEAHRLLMEAHKHFDQAHGHAKEIQKCFGKSAEDPSLGEHVEKLNHHMSEAHRLLAEHVKHHLARGQNLGEAHKETSEWVGEKAQAPGSREGMYDPESGLTALSQRAMTEGEVPAYQSDMPYQVGPSAGLDTASVKGIVAEALQPVSKELQETRAALTKANEDRARAEGRAEAFAQMPAGSPRGRLFTVDKSAFAGSTPSAPSENEIMLAGVDLKSIENNPDAALKAAARVQGNKIVATLTGRHNFGKSMLDPEFQGNAGGRR